MDRIRIVAGLLFLVLGLLNAPSAVAQDEGKKKDKEKQEKNLSKKDRERKKAASKVKRSSLARLGDRYYDNEEYYMAAESYEKALRKDKNDIYAAYRLGKARMAYFDYNEAEQAFAKVMEFPGYEKHYDLATFWYATIKKINGDYTAAKENFQHFIETFEPDPNDPEHEGKLEQAKMELEGCELALAEFKKPTRDYSFELLPSPVNTKGAEFAPVIYEHDSSIVITSSRKGAKGGKTDPRFGIVFTDNFRFHKNQEAKWVETEEEDNFEILNTELNDGAGVFTPDKKKYYYTSCFHEDVCELFVSEKIYGKWAVPRPLNQNVNTEGYFSKQPALSAGGDTLFFVSDRPGGKGMNDIWYSVRQGEGENWGPAKNLEEINTPYIDMSPCYYPKDGVLFFASNGREGFGGLDIYMTPINNLSKVENAGLPFNSNRDDFYFSISNEVGYLSSNREGGIGNDDIYSFSPYSKASTISTIGQDSINQYKSISVTGKLFNEDENAPAVGMNVYVSDSNNNRIMEGTTNPDGAFAFRNLPTDQSYRVGVDENFNMNHLKNEDTGEPFIVVGYDDKGQPIKKPVNNPDGYDMRRLDNEQFNRMQGTMDPTMSRLNNNDPNAPAIVMVGRDENGNPVYQEVKNPDQYGMDRMATLQKNGLTEGRNFNLSRMENEDASAPFTIKGYDEDGNPIKAYVSNPNEYGYKMIETNDVNPSDQDVDPNLKRLSNEDGGDMLLGIVGYNEQNEPVYRQVDDPARFLMDNLDTYENGITEGGHYNLSRMNNEDVTDPFFISGFEEDGRTPIREYVPNPDDYGMQVLYTNDFGDDVPPDFDPNLKKMKNSGSGDPLVALVGYSDDDRPVYREITSPARFRMDKLATHSNGITDGKDYDLSRMNNSDVGDPFTIPGFDGQGQPIKQYVPNPDMYGMDFKATNDYSQPLPEDFDPNLERMENTAPSDPLIGLVGYNEAGEPVYREVQDPSRFRMDKLATNQNQVDSDKGPSLTKKSNISVENLEIRGSMQDPDKTLFENIYFDFDKATLRPEAKNVLDELIAYLNDNPNAQVEIQANTDAVGTSDYNKGLSARRAAAAKSYLLNNGIDATQIRTAAQGEQNALASNKNVIGRQLNRRVEFYIVGGGNYEAEYMAYVVNPGNTLSDIAQRFGMTPEEIKKANNLQGDNIQAYRPLRVRRTTDDKIIAPVTLMAAGGSGRSNSSGTSLPKPPPLEEANEKYYTVQKGQTLYSISKKFNMTVDQLKEMNNLNSNKLLAGQQLRVRKMEIEIGEDEYRVKEGDTMYSIAQQYGMTPEELKNLNDLDSYMLYESMVLKVKK